MAGARAVYAKHGAGSRAAAMIEALLRESPEFAALWRGHEVSAGSGRDKRIQHPEVGIVHVQCQHLVDPDTSQSLLVFTATPGTDDHDKLQLLGVLGDRVIV